MTTALDMICFVRDFRNANYEVVPWGEAEKKFGMSTVTTEAAVQASQRGWLNLNASHEYGTVLQLTPTGQAMALLAYLRGKDDLDKFVPWSEIGKLNLANGEGIAIENMWLEYHPMGMGLSVRLTVLGQKVIDDCVLSFYRKS